MHQICLFSWLIAASPTATAPAPAPAPAGAPAPAPAGPSRALPPGGSPFRLALAYTHVLGEDGELATPQLSTNAVGLDMGFASGSYIRNHLGLGHQWESGPGAARGFRIDLISLGFPIPLLTSTVRLELEPILTLVRGEIMFVSGSGSILVRVESGFGIELSATFARWFVGLEPLAVDFRYAVVNSSRSRGGFARIFPFRVAVGREF